MSFLVSTVILFSLYVCASRQKVDSDFHPIPLNEPKYPKNKGPVVWIDEAHHNIVDTKGRYLPFVEVISRDGYTVNAFSF